jgi:hypothetical protein
MSLKDFFTVPSQKKLAGPQSKESFLFGTSHFRSVWVEASGGTCFLERRTL